jgi:hypothetical protein
MPSMARSLLGGEQRLDGNVHLEGRPQCPLSCDISVRNSKN